MYVGDHWVRPAKRMPEKQRADAAALYRILVLKEQWRGVLMTQRIRRMISWTQVFPSILAERTQSHDSSIFLASFCLQELEDDGYYFEWSDVERCEGR